LLQIVIRIKQNKKIIKNKIKTKTQKQLLPDKALPNTFKEVKSKSQNFLMIEIIVTIS
jgi:hypothetical protein